MAKHAKESGVGHVHIRGARRMGLFDEDLHRQKYLEIMGEATASAGVQLGLFSLMGNHTHLFVIADAARLSACMRELDWRYSWYYNREHGVTGHAYDSRYRVHWQWSPFMMANTLAYIALNPVEAGLVSRPEDYPWSNYRDFLGSPGSPISVDLTAVYKLLGDGPLHARRLVEETVEFQLSHPRQKRHEVLPAYEVQGRQFEWLWSEAELRSSKGRLFGLNPTAVAIYWASERGIPPRAIAFALGDRNASWVSRALYDTRKLILLSPEWRSKLTPP